MILRRVKLHLNGSIRASDTERPWTNHVRRIIAIEDQINENVADAMELASRKRKYFVSESEKLYGFEKLGANVRKRIADTKKHRAKWKHQPFDRLGE